MSTVTAGAPERGARSPYVAAFLSFLFPGLGQWYGGRTRTALLFAGPVLVLLALVLVQVAGSIGQTVALLITPSSALTILILIGLLAVWRILSIGDALTVGGQREPFRRRGTLLTFLGLSGLVVVMHLAMGYMAYAFYDASTQVFVGETSPEATHPPASVLPGESPSASDEYVAAPLATPETKADRINLLLTGIDSYETRTTALTDTILVASIDPETADVTLISIPRDISGFELYDGRTFKGKINSFYTWVKNHESEFDGIKPLNALIKQVGYMIGAPIHYYAAIDLAGFRRMIDLVGGVTVDNPRAINDPRYAWLDGRHGFYLSAGKHKLNGENALAYVRSRQGVGDSDFTRARRQQQVLLALREKLTRPNMLPELPRILKIAGDTVRTNFPSERVGEMIDLATKVETKKVDQYVLGPTKYARRPPYSETGGVYELRLKVPALAKLSIQLFGPKSRYASLPEYAPLLATPTPAAPSASAMPTATPTSP